MKILDFDVDTMRPADGHALYKLEHISKALELDMAETLNYLEAAQGCNVVRFADGHWIDHPTLLRWMLVPAPAKPTSPAAWKYAAGLVEDFVLKAFC